MSEYADFVQDFPTRCQRLLDLASGLARRQGLDVTLMLMVASSGIVIPFEWFNRTGRYPNLSRDWERYEEAADRFDALLKGKFMGSELWPGAGGSWRLGTLGSVEGEPDAWPELRKLPQFADETPVEKVLYPVRHAMSHGNLYTRGRIDGQIRALLFACNKDPEDKSTADPYRFVYVSPEDFGCFLQCWFTFLRAYPKSRS